MSFELTREFVSNLKELIATSDKKSVADLVSHLHPADIADIFDELNIEEAKFLYSDLEGETRADLLIELDDDMSEYILPAGSVAEIAIITEHVHHVAMIRRILLRMKSWQNYLFSEGH